MVVSRSSGINSRTIEESSTSTVSSQPTMISKAALRRRRSKGTIAGFASPGKVASPSASGEFPTGDAEEHSNALGIPSMAQGAQQTSSDSPSAPARPCHSARLALMCCQNAIRMGARTQLGLCPPGRARRSLKSALRQKSRTMRSSFERRSSQTPTDVGGYFGVDKMVGSSSLEDYPAKEEDFLISTNSFDIESDEEASSGDDDELFDVDELLKEDSPALDDEKKYADLNEPLFTQNGSQASGGAGPMTGAGGDSGKLPFNRRKLRYFDSIAAGDAMAARKYLSTETRKSNQREVLMLTRRLRRIQREEKLKLINDRGGNVNITDLVQETETEDALLPAGVAKFQQPMTPSAAAALIIESLSLNPLESIEGMGKCYEGVVAAGMALLDTNRNDPTSPANATNERPTATRTEIIAALTPLLITSLEQTSGEVILSLARIRRMCGTPRYQRRFVQRVAPSLIRPPGGAMWCLKHQNDMEPILAAAELIFDCSVEIFSKGWYDRGQLLLADTKRAETLNAAAMQLRNLSTGEDDHLTLGGSLTSGNWRGSKYKDASKSKGSNDQLAEWEVIALDRQIRVSISDLVSMDWPKVVINAKDSDAARALKSRSTSKRTHGLQGSGEGSPKSMAAPTQSPARTSLTKAPISPHGPPQFPTSFTSDASSDHTFQASFPSGFDVPIPDRNPPPAPPTPPKASFGGEPVDSGASNDFAAPSNLFPPSLPPGHTPPRSPTPPLPNKPDASGDVPNVGLTISSEGAASPLASRRKHYQQNVGSSSPTPPQLEKDYAPISPASPSTSSADVNVPHRPISSSLSTGSSSTVAGSQPAHYRMLTSTAAERKRTVAACRALRAQITRFEDAFVQLHGRPPKGAAERAPLGTTYAQYREWKRAIRADAACRIQALIRGACLRRRLSHSSDPQMLRVVKSRAGRSGSIDQTMSEYSSLEQIRIPAEIGEGVEKGSRTSSGSDDPFNDLAAKNQPLPPQWGSNQNSRRRPASEGNPSPIPTRTASSAPESPSTSPDEFSRLSLPDLQARKRDLKQQLKQYDMNFARRHGRMPVKAEKEPIRHLYEKYNALKGRIGLMEKEGRQSGPASPVPSSAAVLPQRTQSPVSGIESGGDESPVSIRGKLKPVRSSTVPPSSTSGSLSQDLAALKAEKGRLHQMLRSYEKDFYKEHKRQVSSFADIRPVANQYRRYKEIKKTIAALQQGGDK